MTRLRRHLAFATGGLGPAHLCWVVAVTLAALPGLAIVWLRPHSSPPWVGRRPMSRWILEPSVTSRSIAGVLSTT